MSEPASLSATDLARLLGLPDPTPEQAAAVSADLRPRVVVAGAGSGKSETVAARIVWLVATGKVRPEQVLGLTFTRKATGELADRVRARLARLRDTGVVSARVLDGEPTISTYHAYAARLVADHAMREGREPWLRLITPALQWQLAARVVAGYDGPMDAVGWAPATVTAAVLELSGELGEHLRSTDDVRATGDWLRNRAGELPGRLPSEIARSLERQRTREQLLPLLERYAQEKAARDVIDHSDQVALAARIAQRHPEVGTVERSRYRVVVLDEYQDTGYAQLALLRSLFGPPHGHGHPVMAVGDPCQSIYGWRGAAAGNLTRFSRDFPAPESESGDRPSDAGSSAIAQPQEGGAGDDADSAPDRRCVLTTSFRAGQRILETAATLSEPLREQTAIPSLRPGPARVGRGRVVCGLFTSAGIEAEWIAERVRAVLDLPNGVAPDGARWPGSEPDEQIAPDGGEAARAVQPSHVAVLARKRAQLPALRQALERREIPVEVVGLGGLLTVPEVADIVATLRVLHEPTAGAALVRLLTGSRWRIGPRDLVALARRGRELSRMAGRDPHGETAREPSGNEDRLTGSDAGENRDSGPADPLQQAVADMSAAEEAGLVDALDDLGPPERYSSEGYARLAALGQELRELRARADQPLPDLVTDVERTLRLDIEVAARRDVGPVTARADLDAFIDAAARFAGDPGGTGQPTLGAFLAYLAAAEDQEFGLETGRVSQTDSVKLMTVHAAKGLEWPVVALPGLAAGEQASVFPAKSPTPTAWTHNPRKLPFPLRGDRSELPELAGLDPESYAQFAAACTRRAELEERRLAYVAATRASFLLLCSGYWWGDGKTPLGPSVFLREIREACLNGAGEVADWAPPPAPDAANPVVADQPVVTWPAEPSGPRHEATVEGARMVEQALAGEGAQAATAGGRSELSEPERARAEGWALDEQLLLAEGASAGQAGSAAVELPESLSVSAVVTLAHDPAELARQIRRPLPRRPSPQARRGTSFHQWLASRYGQLRLLDPDDVPGAGDERVADDEDLTELQRSFLRTSWATRSPVATEVAFDTAVDDRIVRGRMDAVFRDPDGCYDVVDWKTGRGAAAAQAEAATVQLAVYRLAWADLANVPPEQVRAAFYYVRTGETIRPADLLDRRRLAALVRELPAHSGHASHSYMDHLQG